MSTDLTRHRTGQVSTASPERSIWRGLSEETFRQHLVELENVTNAVPVDPQVFSNSQWHERHGISTLVETLKYSLTLRDEQQLADDFAALVAVDQGAQSVSAACVEEETNAEGAREFTIRLAAVDVALDDAVEISLRRICHILSELAIRLQGEHLSMQEAINSAIPNVFDNIINLHSRRILARLRSCKWQKPRFLSRTHKKPLWQDFSNLLHRVQFLFTKKEIDARQQTETEVAFLATVYENFETLDSTTELDDLKFLVRRSHIFCKSSVIKQYTQRLVAACPLASTGKRVKPQISSALKTLRQIEKIAAYYRIACSLVDLVKQYPTLFTAPIRILTLQPYASVPTTISYEPWAKSTHVHAEVQLAVYYDLLQSRPLGESPSSAARPILPPRVIGTSKYLCFLCHLFLTSHGRFFPSNTHGRLYDQWTIPDLHEYTDCVRDKYEGIVRSMDTEILDRIKAVRTEVNGTEIVEGEDANMSGTTQDKRGSKTQTVLWRAEPMTSRENLILAE